MSTGLTERERRILADIAQELAADRRLARALGVTPARARIGSGYWAGVVTAFVLVAGSVCAVLEGVFLHQPVLFAVAAVAVGAAVGSALLPVVFFLRGRLRRQRAQVAH